MRIWEKAVAGLAFFLLYCAAKGQETVSPSAPPGADSPAVAPAVPPLSTLPPGVTHPRLMNSVAPVYSEKARRKRVSGTVLVELTVDAEGLPTNVHVLQGAGYGLDENAVAAVEQYRFAPAKKDGVPVPATLRVSVSFNIYGKR